MEGAVERVLRSRAAVEQLDDELRACIATRFDAALREAAQLETSGALHRWTIAVKDNMDVAGTVRTDGLAPPHRSVATRDAPAVARLRAAGALVVAKANLEELGFGATTQNAHWGRCRNPWDASRIPGGSSGGSAVAVAAGMVDAALGTDTGGSLRNPAAFCGVTALRPSTGLISRRGVTPLSPTFDVVGPIARSVADLGALMGVLAPRSAGPQPGVLRDLRVGVPSGYFFDDLDPAVAHGCDELLRMLGAAGARVQALRLPGAGEAAEALAVLLNAEAAALHRHMLDDPRLDPQVRDRLALGAATSPSERGAAARTAERWTATVLDALDAFSVLVTPAAPFVAPPIDSTHLIELSRRVNRCNGPWSLARVPALALPLDPQGRLPVGAQIVAAPGCDARLIGVGEALQARTDWHQRRPPLPQGATATIP